MIVMMPCAFCFLGRHSPLPKESTLKAKLYCYLMNAGGFQFTTSGGGQQFHFTTGPGGGQRQFRQQQHHQQHHHQQQQQQQQVRLSVLAQSKTALISILYREQQEELYNSKGDINILTTSNFDKTVLDDSDSIWVVQFYSPSCK